MQFSSDTDFRSWLRICLPLQQENNTARRGVENGVLQEISSASGVRVREFPLSYAVSLLPSKQLQAAQKIFISYVPGIKDDTATIETNRCHALEKSERILD